MYSGASSDAVVKQAKSNETVEPSHRVVIQLNPVGQSSASKQPMAVATPLPPSKRKTQEINVREKRRMQSAQAQCHQIHTIWR